MDTLTGIVLGALVAWTVSLFVEHRRWLPTQGDLFAGMAGGLFGPLLVALATPTPGAETHSVQLLAALLSSGVAIAAWRLGQRLGRQFNAADRSAPRSAAIGNQATS